jgi:hypothetical protein
MQLYCFYLKLVTWIMWDKQLYLVNTATKVFCNSAVNYIILTAAVCNPLFLRTHAVEQSLILSGYPVSELKYVLYHRT